MRARGVTTPLLMAVAISSTLRKTPTSPGSSSILYMWLRWRPFGRANFPLIDAIFVLSGGATICTPGGCAGGPLPTFDAGAFSRSELVVREPLSPGGQPPDFGRGPADPPPRRWRPFGTRCAGHGKLRVGQRVAPPAAGPEIQPSRPPVPHDPTRAPRPSTRAGHRRFRRDRSRVRRPLGRTRARFGDRGPGRRPAGRAGRGTGREARGRRRGLPGRPLPR